MIQWKQWWQRDKSAIESIAESFLLWIQVSSGRMDNAVMRICCLEDKVEALNQIAMPNNKTKLDSSLTETRCTFMCHGRDKHNGEVLDSPVPVVLTFSQCTAKSMFSLRVECEHAVGGHRQRCKASELYAVDLEKVPCPYVMSIGSPESYKPTAFVSREY